jgi:spore coat polysaccharide biosynthesis predicted glycosyltransferase SpsG
MNILIRAYGSHLMGMGHLYRVKKLVNQLRKTKECRITLFTRKYAEAVDIYNSIDVDKLIEVPSEISLKEEVIELNKILKSNFDICINDQLNTNKEVAKILNSYINKTITFDDLGDGNYLFNYVVNVLYPSDNKLKNEITSYEYMLLDDYDNIKHEIIFSEDIKTIFVNQGAADTWGAIPDLIKDLNKIKRNFKLKVLLGPSFKHYYELSEALKNNKKQIEIFNYANSVVDLVKDCDLAILGAGNTLFEVATLGIPIIASTREEKELITIDRLLKDSIVYSENKIYTDGLNELIEKVIVDKSTRKQMYNQNRELFQYDGIDKIIKLIYGE